jgi:hypothetical protein
MRDFAEALVLAVCIVVIVNWTVKVVIEVLL